MISSISAVLFDFDGTLVFHQPDSLDVLSAFCTEIGQPLSADAVRRIRRARHEYFVDPVIRDQLSGWSSSEFWQHFNRHLLEAVCTEGDLDQMAQEVTNRSTDLEYSYYCPEAGCDTLAELRTRGYKLGLITNRDNVGRFHQILNITELGPHFDLVLASGEVGVSKPEPGIFDAALERIGATADQSLYVGDNYWADVVGAQRAGVMPVLLDPHGIFPEAECLILERIDGLLEWLP